MRRRTAAGTKRHSSTSETMRTELSAAPRRAWESTGTRSPAEVVSGIEAAIADLRREMASGDIERIKVKLDAANKAVSKLDAAKDETAVSQLAIRSSL